MFQELLFFSATVKAQGDFGHVIALSFIAFEWVTSWLYMPAPYTALSKGLKCTATKHMLITCQA